ncbi:Uncharacterised protein [Mycobacteroides abscessus subsp. massiliense]|nr:Uncharacterised protein [Mycobacteroides abscessus subsp. massiliense]
MIRPELGDHVTGLVVPLVIENIGGGLRALVVAGEHRLRLQPQLATGMRRICGEVSEFRNVNQLVVGDGRTLQDSVTPHTTGLGGPIPVAQRHLQQRLHELRHLRRQRGRPGAGTEHAPAEVLFPDADLDSLRDLGVALTRGEGPVQFCLKTLEHHLHHTRHEEHLGGANEGDVLEEGRKIARSDVVGGSAT